MNVIYADSLFLLNGVINYILLLLTGRICSLPLRRGRFALGAALGGAYAVAAALPPAGFLRTLPVKLALGGLMCLAAYGYSRRLWRWALSFLAVSAAFAGAIYALAMAAGVPDAGALTVPVSLKTLALSFAVCYAALALVLRRRGDALRRRVRTAEVSLLGKSVSFPALSDSGNELRDPAGGRKVLVADFAALAPLFPPGTGTLLAEQGAAALVETLSRSEGYAPRLSLVPYRAVGTAGGLLAAFRPDRLCLDGRETDAFLVALSPTPLGGDGDYSAVYQEDEL